MSDDYMDVFADGIGENFFTQKPEVLTREEKRAWLDQMTEVALGSDAFSRLATMWRGRTEAVVKYISSRAARSEMTMLSRLAISMISQCALRGLGCFIINIKNIEKAVEK